MATPILLIQKSDFVDWKTVSVNVDSIQDLNAYIRESQEFDLQPVLGAYLFREFQNNATGANPIQKYADLLNGKTYIDSSGNEFEFKGVKPVLVYYTYARLLVVNGVKQTYSGFVTKTLDDSTMISNAQRAEMINQAKSGAKKFEDDLVKYLLDFSVDFPLWKGGIRKNTGTVKITAI